MIQTALILTFIIWVCQAREYLVEKLMTTMKNRRRDGVIVRDALGAHMAIDQFKVSDYEICCVMIAFMFAGYITTATLLPWVMKYLNENPEVLQHVQVDSQTFRTPKFQLCQD